jgi:hypothetical protein
MTKKLDKALDEALTEQKEKGREAMPAAFVADIPIYDVRDDAKMSQDKVRLQPAFSSGDTLDPDEEPADKALIQIQHYFMNGEFEKASQLLQTLRGMKRGTFFSWHHMNQLIDWVRNVYKYTNMKDLSKNYYDYEMAKDMEIAGATDLKKIGVKEAVVEKFIKEAEKVLKKKLEMR